MSESTTTTSAAVARNPFDLTGYVGVVTGAAQGMGLALTKALVANGAAVCMVDLNGETLAKAEKEIAELGGTVNSIAVDISGEDAPEQIHETARKLGEVDILINNAGIVNHKPFTEWDDSQWDKMLNINLRAPMRLTRPIIAAMAERGTGSIINIGSSWSSRASLFNQSGGGADYNTSKAGLQALTRSLAHEYAPKGVRVNAIAPGAVDTPMHAHHREFLYSYEKYIPLGRMQQADDITGTAVYLASPASSYVTGQTIHVNGGLLMVD